MLLLQSNCGCLRVYDETKTGLLLTDSNRLPGSQLRIVRIRVAATTYEVGEVFPDLEAFVSWLNTTFVITANLAGIWVKEPGGIYYTNPENFLSAELMAVLTTDRDMLIVPDGATSVMRTTKLLGAKVLQLATPSPLADAAFLAVQGYDPTAFEGWDEAATNAGDRTGPIVFTRAMIGQPIIAIFQQGQA